MSKMTVKILTLTVILALPLISGCFGSKGANPVADTSLSDASSNLAAQSVSSTSNPALDAARFTAPVSTGKKYSFAPPPHKVLHSLKAGTVQTPGSLKVRFLSASKADNILITFEDLKVKPEAGKSITITMPETEINLLDSADVSSVLADAQLPEGKYNYFEISIKKASVVLDGKAYPMFVPSKRIFFVGKFEIKNGFSTDLTVKFSQRVLKIGKWFFKLLPVVKISTNLVAQATEVTEGDVSGLVQNYVSKANLAGINVALTGGSVSLSAVTDVNGKFEFLKVPAGDYTLNLTSPDFLDKNFQVQVLPGQVAQVSAEMNPAIILSAVSNTGWFSERYPLADAHGTYGEIAMETPVVIDFVSLAFLKAELKFNADYRNGGATAMSAYLSSSQQVAKITDLGGWWAGNNALLGYALGDFFATNPATEYKLEVTDYVRNNPSASYFFAGMNRGVADIRLVNIQMAIYYK